MTKMNYRPTTLLGTFVFYAASMLFSITPLLSQALDGTSNRPNDGVPAGVEQGENKAAIENGLEFPANLLMMDSAFSHHVAIAEKSTHQLHLFKNQDGRPRYIKSYKVATGKKPGDKSSQGDFKTPEGIYQLTSFLNEKQLYNMYGQEAKIYGPGAFVLNYPNVMDIRAKKTGSGIWLHSTDDINRISKGLDSRGCVVVSDRDLKDISQYIDLQNTSLIIVQDLFFLRKQTWESNRADLQNTIKGWLKAWQEENLQEYLSYYHPELYSDPQRKNFRSFKAYKESVFRGPGKPEINLSFVSILTFDQYTVIQFQQDYRSDKINDAGKKTLYLARDKDYKWKIVAETWNNLPQRAQMAFTPSMRFFSDFKTSAKDI